MRDICEKIFVKLINNCISGYYIVVLRSSQKKAKYVTSYNSKGSKSIPLEQGLRHVSHTLYYEVLCDLSLFH